MAAIASRVTRGASFGPLPWAARWRGAVVVVLAATVSALGLHLVPATMSEHRVTSEIAHNDAHQLVRAWSTADVNFHLYYKTLSALEARARAARVLGFGELVARDAECPLQKRVAAPHAPEAWDVVILIEESLGSEYVGVLGHEDRELTPGFDRWSHEGLLLANLVPTGNRTVRGLEGTLCSFVPLPGDSVVKRDKSEGLATVAGVFQQHRYATSFIYGGIGFFDHMKPFLTANGYDEFIEQPDYPEGTFATAWGVADEAIFDALLQRQRDAVARGERLFATALSVSNHRPFDVPPGRVDCPEGRSRACAVKYADWALARYLDQARDEGLLEHTVVLVLGDHGARVYGSSELPAASYRIPGLFLVPGDQWRGQRLERLCSQIDLAPTLLSLVGLSYTAPFFGSDLTADMTESGGRAFVQHNRDVGLLTDTDMVVLSLQGRVEYYRRSCRTSDELEPVTPDSRLLELEKDASAVFQVAYDLYHEGRFVLPAQAEGGVSAQ